ncbi:aspartate aminotransferase-like isoform X2 [Glandiceps talaboti]
MKLRTTICDFHARLDGITHLTPDNVIVAPGSKELIYLMLAVFNGDVMVLSPSWTTYKPQTMLAGLNAITIQLKQEDGWRLTPNLVEQVILENKLGPNRLLIMCNPDNPTGTCYTVEHLKQLSEVFRKHKIIVLSDEIYSRLHFENNHASLAKFYPEGCILSTGLSKWASAGGWRLGYHIYPSELSVLKNAVCSAASHTYSCAPAPMQHAAIWLHEWSEEVKDYVVHERRVLQAAAKYCHRELTSVGVKAVMPTAGYYMFPNFEILRPAMKARGITTGTQFCDAIFNEAHVALMSGGPAFLRPIDEFTVRLCYINFDGTNALKGSRKADPKIPLGDEFLKEYCLSLVEAIQSLKKWVVHQLKNGDV